MGFDYSEPLMQWKEPSGFQQNRKQFYSLLFIGVAVTILIILAIEFLPKGPNDKVPGAIVLLPCTILGVVLVGFFMRGTVALKAEGIACAAGRGGAYIRYDEIESCQVKLLTYPDTQCHLLKFAIKDPDKFRIVAPAGGLIVPKEVNLNSVLEFLRNKGVHVIEDPVKQ